MTYELFLARSHKSHNNKNINKLYLGDWCANNPLQQDKINTCEYYLEKKKVDYEYLDSQYKLTLTKISKDLNRFHNKNYNIQYWNLLIGPFIQILLHTFYDRYNILKYCFDNYEINKIYCNHKIKEINFDIKNTTDFTMRMSHQDIINEYFFYNIIKKMEDKNFFKKINFFKEPEVISKNKYLIKRKTWLQ